MKTKEAINWLNANKYLTRHKEVIALLKRGEKYEKMWEELINKKGWVFILKEDIHNIFLYDVMKKLEQKYFPKEVN